MKNRFIAVTLISLIAVTVLTGCGKKKVGDITVGAGENAIFLEKNGKVSYAIGETFDKDYYDKKDLKEKIKNEVKDFNKSSHSAKLNSFWIQDKLATAIFTFSSKEEFADYIHDCNGIDDFYIGDIAGAITSGYDIVGEFTKVEGGNLTQQTAISKDIKGMSGNIIVVDHPTKIQLESGDIKYVSSNCKVDGGIVTVSSDTFTAGQNMVNIAYVVYE